MKITKRQLRRIIREERNKLNRRNLQEGIGVGFAGWSPNRQADFAKAYGKGAIAYGHPHQRHLHEQPISGEQAKEMARADDHHWPRVEWSNADDLVDKWHDMEIKAFDTGDPSMNPEDGTLTDNKDFWREQVDAASYDLEAELIVRIRQAALQTMKEISEKLINGDYA